MAIEPVRQLVSRISPLAFPIVALCLFATTVTAGPVDIRVLDARGEPVPDVVVTADVGPARASPAATGRAVMDQIDLRFEPHVLVVRTGTRVEFPNSDSVAHHVYSFSHPNQFNLPMYKGDAHPPVRFEEPGVVSLGCNIHDDMLGYIAVVDSANFAKTNEDGLAVLDLPEGTRVRVSIWSPRIRAEKDSLTSVLAPGGHGITFRLEKSLRPPHGEQADSLSWSDY